MKLNNQQRKVFNYFNGNEDLNVISKIALYLKGHSEHSSALQQDVNIVTDKDAKTSDEISPS